LIYFFLAIKLCLQDGFKRTSVYQHGLCERDGIQYVVFTRENFLFALYKGAFFQV